jgi:hypothetical protein
MNEQESYNELESYVDRDYKIGQYLDILKKVNDLRGAFVGISLREAEAIIATYCRERILDLINEYSTEKNGQK